MNHKIHPYSLLAKVLPVFMVALLLVTACAPAATPETPMPTSTKEVHSPTTMPTVPPTNTPNPAKSGPTSPVMQDLAQKLTIDVSKITVQSIEAVEWPDSCLGVVEKGVYCAQVITPGYKIILEAEGQTYEYHTNQSGSSLVMVSNPVPVSRIPVITYHREGGIAGFCDDVIIYSAGTAKITSCKTTKAAEITLPSDQMDTISQWLNKFQGFNYSHTDPATADAMTINLKFSGNGQSQASDADIQAMLSLLSQIAVQYNH